MNTLNCTNNTLLETFLTELGVYLKMLPCNERGAAKHALDVKKTLLHTKKGKSTCRINSTRIKQLHN